MAENVKIGGSGNLFVGEDKTFRLELLDAAGVPVDMTGWVVRLDVRTSDTAAAALLSGNATITGTYNAARAVNTQRAELTATDTQMGAFSSTTYRHSWKRTDDGSETILCYGDFRPQRATQA
jgi:hypothetical protein